SPRHLRERRLVAVRGDVAPRLTRGGRRAPVGQPGGRLELVRRTHDEGRPVAVETDVRRPGFDHVTRDTLYPPGRVRQDRRQVGVRRVAVGRGRRRWTSRREAAGLVLLGVALACVAGAGGSWRSHDW